MSLHVGAGKGPGHLNRMPQGSVHASTPLGFAATRGMMFTLGNTGNKQSMSRSTHVATTNISNPMILIHHFLQGTGLEVGQTSQDAVTVECSIEYPAGTMTRMTFPAPVQSGGNPNIGLIPACKSTGAVQGDSPSAIWTDRVALGFTIPSGATFWVRMLKISTIGVMWVNNAKDAANGDRCQLGVTVTNNVMSGTVTDNGGSAVVIPPLAIVDAQPGPSVLGCGDSIMQGLNDSTASDGRQGIVFRGFPTGVAFVNAAIGGQKAADFLTNSISRALLFPYAKKMVCNLGINDAAPASTISSNRTAIAAAMPAGCVCYGVTLTPRSLDSGTGSPLWWTTVASQTAHGSDATLYIPFSNLVRAGSVVGYSATYCEVTRGVLESSLDSGLWALAASPFVISDGVMNSGSGVFTSASNPFVAGHVGGSVVVPGAGAAGALLHGTITAFTNAGSVTLGLNASTSVTGASCHGVGISPDGLHPQALGYATVASSGAIPAAVYS